MSVQVVYARHLYVSRIGIREAQAVLAALIPAIGTRMRWMSPSTDGRHLVSVHTPHIGGVLHLVRRDEGRLISTRLADGVSNHAIGSHDLEQSTWIGQRVAQGDMSRRVLRSFDLARGLELPPLDLPAALRALSVDA